MDIALARSELECLRRTACTMITGAMRTTPTKVLEMLLDVTTLGTTVGSGIWRPDPRNLGIGLNRIWAKSDKVDSKFSLIKDHVTMRRTFGKYRIVIPAKEEWGKNWCNQLRNGHIWFTDGAYHQ